jgi:Cu+-exporting ATPase
VKSSCYHCGEDCGQHPILLDEKPFCCEGCKMVYQILSENDLCTYYDLESHPGISLKSREQGTRFEYLDSPEIVDRLIEYQDESQTRITFYLPQVHCSSCIWLLEKLYKLRPGILHSQVNFLKKELYLSFDPETISLREVVELLTTLGYEPEINLQDLNRKKDSKYNRRLFYQLGVAGFAFGNIMLFSFPEYLALESYLEPEFAQLFGYLNLRPCPAGACSTAPRTTCGRPGLACGREGSTSMSPFPWAFSPFSAVRLTTSSPIREPVTWTPWWDWCFFY